MDNIEVNDIETLKNIHSARGEFYAFLCRLFGNVPNAEFYRILEGMSEKLKMLSEASKDDGLKGAVGEILSFLEKRGTLGEEERRKFELEVSRHYTTMFCLVKSIPTDESIWTSTEHRERLDPYDKMRALFSKYGIKRREDIPENEDFVSYELYFMSQMAYRSARLLDGDLDGYESSLEEQRNFHTNHFDKWIYEFFDGTVNFGIEGETLYRHLGILAACFLREDKEALKGL